MKRDELQPAMPKLKLRVYLVLLLVAAVMIGGACIQGLPTQDRAASIYVGVTLSLLFTTVPDLWTEVLRRGEALFRRQKFQAFFGLHAGDKGPVQIVLIQRQLRQDIGNPFISYYTEQVFQEREFTPDINSWQAMQDLRATVYLTNAISASTGRHIRLMTDKEFDLNNMHHPTLAVGLTSMLVDTLRDSFKKPIFSWLLASDPKQDKLFVGGEEVKHDEDDNVAIVARVVLPGHAEQANNVFFVCAGLWAQGTSVAGCFLASRWKELYDEYRLRNRELDRDSCAVAIRYRSQMDAAQQADATNYYVFRDDECQYKMIAWDRADGIGQEKRGNLARALRDLWVRVLSHAQEMHQKHGQKN